VVISMSVGPIAQSVEQRTFNPWVDGSSPSGPTSVFKEIATPSSYIESDPLLLTIQILTSQYAKTLDFSILLNYLSH
jgi:hypothetical protein